MIILSTTEVTNLLDLLEGRPPETAEEQVSLHNLYVRLRDHRALVSDCQSLVDMSAKR